VRDKIVLYSQPGALPEDALEDIVSQIEALDMEAVRREIAEQETAAP
jgi:thioredoxin 1